jgi:hypothetical protein
MGSPKMRRSWTVLPLLMLIAVPVWTMPSWWVVAPAVIAAAFGAVGIASGTRAPITAAGVLAILCYALALRGGGVNVVGASLFGLALLFLLDLSEFARRFRGAEVTAAVMRAQLAFWLGRAAVIVGAVALLSLCGFVFSLLVPSTGRAVVAGAGALIAFAAALYAGTVRTGVDEA